METNDPKQPQRQMTAEEIAESNAILRGEHGELAIELNRRLVLTESKLRFVTAALKVAHESVCSYKCPSTWKTADGQPHSDECKRIIAIIAEAEGMAS